jgi:hypothetical protein
MKITLIIFLLIFNTGNLLAQKLYIWCPKEQIPTPRQGFLERDTVSLVIFDGRILSQKSKVECTSEETITKLAEFIKLTYPSTTIDILNPEQYYKEPTKNRITVKIGISAYHAAFGSDVKIGIGSVGGNFSYGIFPEGKWNAVTAYAVKIYDYRNNIEIKQEKDILKTASRPNTGGYLTAKNILNTSFIEANQEMLFFIDGSLMK